MIFSCWNKTLDTPNAKAFGVSNKTSGEEQSKEFLSTDRDNSAKQNTEPGSHSPQVTNINNY